MENSRYELGEGMMGGPKGTYGRYSIGSRVLSGGQFANADNVEEKQRRRFGRKREKGFVGTGFWFANYPYMTGAMGSGAAAQPLPYNPNDPQDGGDQTAAATDGTGMGGTAAGFVGGLGS